MSRWPILIGCPLLEGNPKEGGDGTDAFLGNELLTNKMVTDVDAFAEFLSNEYSDTPAEPAPQGSRLSSASGVGVIAAVVAALDGIFALVAGPAAEQCHQLAHQISGRF